MSPRWHDVIERAVDRNPVSATLVRIGTPDIEVSLNITPIQYQETAAQAGVAVVQQTRRWLVPARRLAALDFPVPLVPGDLVRIPALGIEARISVVGPGMADGAVVRWDITEEGAQ